MNDTQVTKRKIGRLIAKNLIVMLVAVIVALTGVLAWFSHNVSPEADGVSVECKAPDGVYIAIVEHGGKAPSPEDYTTTITLNEENYPFLKNLFMTEITGDGINGSFSRPALTQSGGKAVVDTSVDWSKAVENQDFLSFDLYIKSEASHKIAFSSGSSIAPVSSTLSWGPGDSTAGFNPSSSGDFSRDCIVGAVRFSVVNTSNVRQLLWIPAPNIKLSEEANSVETNLTLGDTYIHHYYTPEKKKEYLNNSAVIANYSSSDPYKLGESVEIVDLITQNPDDKCFYEHVTCNLWIEGEDEESRLALVGGEYKVRLELQLLDD